MIRDPNTQESPFGLSVPGMSRSGWALAGSLVVSGLAAAALALAQGEKKSSDAPVPEPDKGVEVSKEKKEGTKNIVIECQGQAYFNNLEHVVVFEKDVTVRHPTFYMECEELEVILKEDVASTFGTEREPAPAPQAPAEGAAPSEPSDQIEKIFAYGKDRLVALRRKSPKGDVLAKCGRATYDSKTGDMVLFDWPVVNRGNESVQATEKDTIIYIRANGDFETSNGGAIFQKAAKE